MDVDVDENLKLLVEVLGKQMPFGQSLGLTPDSFDTDNDCIRFPWRDTLIGHPICKLLHGGAISSILDIQGSFMVLLEHIRSSNFKASGKGGTIDLRVDYLLPGKGRHFVTSANILRMGGKVAVARMALHNAKHQLIAVGTGTYMLG